MEVRKNNKEIQQIMFILKHRGYLSTIERYDYTTRIDVDQELEVIQAIGETLIDGFVLDQYNKQLYKQLLLWLLGDKEHFYCQTTKTHGGWQKGDLKKGIYLAGNIGVGKTCAMRIMCCYVRARDIQVKLGMKASGEALIRPLAWSQVSTSEIIEHYIQVGSIEKYRKIGILLIEDLGTEPPEAMSMGNRLPVMAKLLEDRADDPTLITLITTNLPMNDDLIKLKYGHRVMDRLREKYNYFELGGPSRRK